jgi:uncharacterized membrane protein
MDSVVTVHRGQTATLSFKLANRSGTTVGASATAPKGLGVSGTRSLKIAPLKNGQSETLKVTLKVGKKAKLGTNKVEVRLTVGGRSTTQTVTVHVTR